eukprot:GHVS01010390.1.p1 GENE.GHVS01010390.1~~GHVS01010390.1.p1  ORF type:complete len:2036 (-),score=229.70 GHVS01010390.1:415-6051(-)
MSEVSGRVGSVFVTSEGTATAMNCASDFNQYMQCPVESGRVVLYLEKKGWEKTGPQRWRQKLNIIAVSLSGTQMLEEISREVDICLFDWIREAVRMVCLSPSSRHLILAGTPDDPIDLESSRDISPVDEPDTSGVREDRGKREEDSPVVGQQAVNQVYQSRRAMLVDAEFNQVSDVFTQDEAQMLEPPTPSEREYSIMDYLYVLCEESLPACQMSAVRHLVVDQFLSGEIGPMEFRQRAGSIIGADRNDAIDAKLRAADWVERTSTDDRVAKLQLVFELPEDGSIPVEPIELPRLAHRGRNITERLPSEQEIEALRAICCGMRWVPVKTSDEVGLHGHAVVEYMRKAFIVGGAADYPLSKSGCLDSCRVIDLVDFSVSAISLRGDAPSSRESHTLCLAEGALGTEKAREEMEEEDDDGEPVKKQKLEGKNFDRNLCGCIAIMFGGYDLKTQRCLGDVWFLNLSSERWSPHPSPIPIEEAPPPRQNHCAAICNDDPSRQLMIVYGGIEIHPGGEQNVLCDMWALSLWNLVWTLVDIDSDGLEVLPRYGATLLKVDGNRLCIFGGKSQSTKNENGDTVDEMLSELWTLEVQAEENPFTVSSVWQLEDPESSDECPEVPGRAYHSGVILAEPQDEGVNSYLLVISGEVVHHSESRASAKTGRESTDLSLYHFASRRWHTVNALYPNGYCGGSYAARQMHISCFFNGRPSLEAASDWSSRPASVPCVFIHGGMANTETFSDAWVLSLTGRSLCGDWCLPLRSPHADRVPTPFGRLSPVVPPDIFWSLCSQQSWPLGSIAHLLDNSIFGGGATRVGLLMRKLNPSEEIAYRMTKNTKTSPGPLLHIQDNGRGLGYQGMRTLLTSFGVPLKDARCPKFLAMYGMGFKMAFSRLSSNVLVMSRTYDSVGIGLLSRDLMRHCDAPSVSAPLCAWRLRTKQIVCDGPCGETDHAHHQALLLKYSLYDTPAAMAKAANELGTRSGTRMILWELRNDIDGFCFRGSVDGTYAGADETSASDRDDPCLQAAGTLYPGSIGFDTSIEESERAELAAEMNGNNGKQPGLSSGESWIATDARRRPSDSKAARLVLSSAFYGLKELKKHPVPENYRLCNCNSPAPKRRKLSANKHEVARADVVGPSDETAPDVVGASEVTAPDVVGASDETAPDVVGASDETAPDVVGASDETAPDVVDASDETAPDVVGASDETAPDVVGASDETAADVTEGSTDEPSSSTPAAAAARSDSSVSEESGRYPTSLQILGEVAGDASVAAEARSCDRDCIRWQDGLDSIDYCLNTYLAWLYLESPACLAVQRQAVVSGTLAASTDENRLSMQKGGESSTAEAAAIRETSCQNGTGDDSALNGGGSASSDPGATAPAVRSENGADNVASRNATDAYPAAEAPTSVSEEQENNRACDVIEVVDSSDETDKANCLDQIEEQKVCVAETDSDSKIDEQKVLGVDGVACNTDGCNEAEGASDEVGMIPARILPNDNRDASYESLTPPEVVDDQVAVGDRCSDESSKLGAPADGVHGGAISHQRDFAMNESDAEAVVAVPSGLHQGSLEGADSCQRQDDEMSAAMVADREREEERTLRRSSRLGSTAMYSTSLPSRRKGSDTGECLSPQRTENRNGFNSVNDNASNVDGIFGDLLTREQPVPLRTRLKEQLFAAAELPYLFKPSDGDRGGYALLGFMNDPICKAIRCSNCGGRTDVPGERFAETGILLYYKKRLIRRFECCFPAEPKDVYYTSMFPVDANHFEAAEYAPFMLTGVINMPDFIIPSASKQSFYHEGSKAWCAFSSRLNQLLRQYIAVCRDDVRLQAWRQTRLERYAAFQSRQRGNSEIPVSDPGLIKQIGVPSKALDPENVSTLGSSQILLLSNSGRHPLMQ